MMADEEEMVHPNPFEQCDWTKWKRIGDTDEWIRRCKTAKCRHTHTTTVDPTHTR